MDDLIVSVVGSAIENRGRMSHTDLFLITLSFEDALGGCESLNRRHLTAVINQDIFMDIVCPCKRILIRKYPFIHESNDRIPQNHYLHQKSFPNHLPSILQNMNKTDDRSSKHIRAISIPEKKIHRLCVLVKKKKKEGIYCSKIDFQETIPII